MCAISFTLKSRRLILSRIAGFDEGLDRHIWALSDQSLQWDDALARKRREKPGEVRRLVGELLNTQRATDEAEAAEWDALKLDVEDQAENEMADEDVAETEEAVRRAYAVADELGQSVPRQAERAERLRSVTAEVKALRA